MNRGSAGVRMKSMVAGAYPALETTGRWIKLEPFFVEPKTKHSEHEEDGTRIERTTIDDPETKSHAEEIKVERKERKDDPDREKD